MSCPICDNPDIEYYDLMGNYCGKEDQLEKDICNMHKIHYNVMAFSFFTGVDNAKFVEALKVEGAYFETVGDDGFGMFLSHNSEEAEKMSFRLKQYAEDSIQYHTILGALADTIPMDDIPTKDGKIDIPKLFSKIKDWRESYYEHQ